MAAAVLICEAMINLALGLVINISTNVGSFIDLGVNLSFHKIRHVVNYNTLPSKYSQFQPTDLFYKKPIICDIFKCIIMRR